MASVEECGLVILLLFLLISLFIVILPGVGRIGHLGRMGPMCWMVQSLPRDIRLTQDRKPVLLQDGDCDVVVFDMEGQGCFAAGAG
jgi:hypothetical protein